MRYPYWARSNGTDHFWVSGHDGGKYEYAVDADRRLASGAHCLANTADPHRGIRRDIRPHEPLSFHPARDVAAVAGASDAYWEDAWHLPKPLGKRRTLVFFAGKLVGVGVGVGVEVRVGEGS